MSYLGSEISEIHIKSQKFTSSEYKLFIESYLYKHPVNKTMSNSSGLAIDIRINKADSQKKC